MNRDTYDQIMSSLGICACSDDSLTWLVKRLLEIGESRADAYDNDDENEAEVMLYHAWLEQQATLVPEHASSGAVLAWLTAAGLIEHEDGDTEGFWLSDLGGEVLETMRVIDRERMVIEGAEKPKTELN